MSDKAIKLPEGTRSLSLNKDVILGYINENINIEAKDFHVETEGDEESVVLSFIESKKPTKNRRS